MEGKSVKHVVAKNISTGLNETFDLYDVSALHENDIGSRVYSEDDGRALSTSVINLTSRVDEMPDDIKGLYGYITPQMFGAKGDGTTNDTVAFQNMFSNSNNLIIIPDGTYKITSIILVNPSKTVINYGTFNDHKPVWKREFDLEQSSMFGLVKEFNLLSEQSYGEGITYDSKRNKIYVGTRNYSSSTEYMDLMIFDADTLNYERSLMFSIAAVASMSYNTITDKIYVTCTGSGNGKTNALYSIDATTLTLDGEITTPHDNQFICFDPVAKTNVCEYKGSTAEKAWIRVYNEDMTSTLKTMSITLSVNDSPQQGFLAYDGHIYTPTFNSILEMDYISGEFKRLNIINPERTCEEMEDFTVGNGKIYALGHRVGGDSSGVERIYVYGEDSVNNYVSMSKQFIVRRREAVTSGTISIAAGAYASTPTFSEASVDNYTLLTTCIENAVGSNSDKLILNLSAAGNKVNIYNPYSSTATLTSLYLRHIYVRNDLYRSVNVNF